MKRMAFLIMMFSLFNAIEGFSQSLPLVRYYFINPTCGGSPNFLNQNSNVRTDSIGDNKYSLMFEQDFKVLDSLLNQDFEKFPMISTVTDELILLKPGLERVKNLDLDFNKGIWSFDRMPCYVPQNGGNMPIMKPDSLTRDKLLIKKP